MALHRHLVFATDQQMRLLQKAKRLYLDATFKVVKAPFTQLFSIHCFIRHGDSMKQVPLAYFLMSGKSKEDYKAVLQAAVECAGQTQVAEVVMDFEAAIWHGVKVVFPEILLLFSGYPCQVDITAKTPAICSENSRHLQRNLPSLVAKPPDRKTSVNQLVHHHYCLATNYRRLPIIATRK